MAPFTTVPGEPRGKGAATLVIVIVPFLVFAVLFGSIGYQVGYQAGYNAGRHEAVIHR